MGKGGYVVLINGTNYLWRKSYSHTYQMNAWNFPDQIKPGTCVKSYIEWNEGIFKNPHDDKGEVTYVLEGLGYSFLIQANGKNGFNIYAKYDNLSNLGSNFITLGFRHNSITPFCIAGDKNKFISSGTINGASDWMANNLDLVGNRLLKNLCLPGSHDSGMSSIHSPTFFVNKDNTQTQSLEVKNQLLNGIRYFDIRPIIGSGGLHTGHYSKVGPGWQGARGQSIESIIRQINDFTSNKRELIILNLSHSLNTDLGNSKYRSFTQDEYNRLFNQLKGIKNLFSVQSNEEINLLEKPLNFFLQDNKSAVCIVLADNGISLDSFHHQGFYTRNEFSIVDDYANSNNLDKMINDQLQKMSRYRKTKSNYFLASWILTLQGAQNVTGPSIEHLADLANRNLYRIILDSSFENLIRKGYPNIIIQDFVSSDVTALSFAINFFNNNDAFVISFLESESVINKTVLKIYFSFIALILLIFILVFTLSYFYDYDSIYSRKLSM